MSNKCYAEEFKIEAAKPIAERPYPVAEVSARSQTGRFSFFITMNAAVTVKAEHRQRKTSFCNKN